jgi:hypothetical protein
LENNYLISDFERLVSFKETIDLRQNHRPENQESTTLPDLNDIRVIASKLEGTEIGAEPQFSLSVLNKGKLRGFAWSWMERVEPKKPKIPNPGVIAIIVPNLEVKEMLTSHFADYFVDDPHYNGYPAILVRLEKISHELLEEWIVEGWKIKTGRKS